MSEAKQVEPLPDVSTQQSTDEKRRRYARLFALACLVGAALWGANVYKRIYPHDVKIQYHYKGLGSLKTLKQVHAALFVPEQKKPHAQVIFYHHGQLTSRAYRTQKLKLPKGKYPILITLRYPKSTRKMRHLLHVHDSGTYYIKLNRAR